MTGEHAPGRGARAALRRNRALRTAAALYRHRACGPDDVIVASYPKSGNTWLKFLLADVLTDSDPDFARSERAIPLLGSPAGSAVLPGGGHLWKSHEPYSPLYRRRCRRAVYLVRDARDVAISEYHFLTRKGRFEGDLDAFLDVFLAGSADGYGSWDAHVASWCDGWRGAQRDRISVRYEDMLADCEAALAGVLRFLGADVPGRRVARAVERNSFARMRAKEIAGAPGGRAPTGSRAQVRSGTAGQWRSQLSDDQRARFWAAMPQLARMGYEE
jgi:Sulfotransferase domain